MQDTLGLCRQHCAEWGRFDDSRYQALDEWIKNKKDGELIEMKKIIFIIVVVGLLLGSAMSAEAIIQPLTIAGHLKDKNGYAIGGWKVYSKNIRTGETINNGTFNVTSTEGYQIQWGNSQYGWQTGDILKVWAWYHDGNKNYTKSQQITVPTDIVQQGSLIILDLKMDEYVGPIDNSTNTSDGRTKAAFNVFGTVTKDGVPINAVIVTVKNICTGNFTTGATANGGKYSVNLGTLKKGWKAGDKIKVNATYQNYAGESTFVIYPGTTQRQKDLTLWLMVDDPAGNSTHPISYEELFSLYNITKQRFADGVEEFNALQNKTDGLQGQLSDQDDNVSALRDQVNRQKGELPWLYIGIIVALAVAVAFLFYQWWTYRAMLVEASQRTTNQSRTSPIHRR
jgi:hypothetical protein